MIAVRKGMGPDGLEELCKECMAEGLSPKESYDRLRNPLKQQVMDCLKRDQGQLCVYCMSRIPRDDRDLGIPGQTIEHYIPLAVGASDDIGRGLDYQNMYAVCHGNTKWHRKGSRGTRLEDGLTCDKHRKNTKFKKINPMDATTLQTIFYKLNGEIHAADPDAEFDLVDTLNLNCSLSPLVFERKAALDALISDMEQLGEEDLPIYCEEVLESFLNEETPKTPYVGILIWYLQSLLNRNS